ncbi:hypothetical protein RB200_21065 [Streptomyces sp. PmtG]
MTHVDVPDQPDQFGPFDGEALDRVAAAALRVPGVADAAAVVRRTLGPAARPETAAPGPPPPAGAADRPLADLDGGPLTVPDGAPATLQEALRAAAAAAPDRGTVYLRRDHDDDVQTYPELLAEAERALAGLRAAGLRPGDSALFVFADNRAYLTAFWACVLGGFVPAPVAVAPTYQTPNEPSRKLRNAWELLGRPVLITVQTRTPPTPWPGCARCGASPTSASSPPRTSSRPRRTTTGSPRRPTTPSSTCSPPAAPACPSACGTRTRGWRPVRTRSPRTAA